MGGGSVLKVGYRGDTGFWDSDTTIKEVFMRRLNQHLHDLINLKTKLNLISSEIDDIIDQMVRGNEKRRKDDSVSKLQDDTDACYQKTA